MPDPHSTLDDLRREIDEIDDEMHDLLMRRTKVVDAIGADVSEVKVGDRVAVVPAHACTTINLHPAVLVVRGATSRWEPIDARGWR